MNAIFKQIATKTENGTIGTVTIATAAKMFTARATYGAGQTLTGVIGNGFVPDPAMTIGGDIGGDGEDEPIAALTNQSLPDPSNQAPGGSIAPMGPDETSDSGPIVLVMHNPANDSGSGSDNSGPPK